MRGRSWSAALRAASVALAGALLVGCASFPRVSEPPRAPSRDGAAFIEGAAGARLWTAVHAPRTEPWGVVYFVTGPEVGSDEPYPELARALDAAGIATVALHVRGSGFSSGVRGDVEDYALVLEDLQRGLDHAWDTFPGKRIFLFGHSVGAAFALHVATHARTPIAGVVLVNPAYRLRYAEGMGPSFGDYLRFAFDTAFRWSSITVDMNSNPAAVKDAADREEGLRMQRDPAVVRYFSMRAMFGERSVIADCEKNAAALEVPLLLVQGERDALVDPSGSDAILAAARVADKTKLSAPRGAHGATAVETVVGDLVAWLERHRAAPPAQPLRARRLGPPQIDGDPVQTAQAPFAR